MERLITDRQLLDIVERTMKGDDPLTYLHKDEYTGFITKLADLICDTFGGTHGYCGVDIEDGTGYGIMIEPADGDKSLWDKYRREPGHVKEPEPEPDPHSEGLVCNITISSGNYEDALNCYREFTEEAELDDYIDNPEWNDKEIEKDFSKIMEQMELWVSRTLGPIQNRHYENDGDIVGKILLTAPGLTKIYKMSDDKYALCHLETSEGVRIYQADTDFFEEGFLDTLTYKGIYLLANIFLNNEEDK